MSLVSFWFVTIFSFILTIYILYKIIKYNNKEKRYDRKMQMSKKISGNKDVTADYVYIIPFCNFS